MLHVGQELPRVVCTDVLLDPARANTTSSRSEKKREVMRAGLITFCGI